MLEKGAALLFVEPFDDFADVLGAFAGADEQGIVGFDDDKILHADGGDELFRSPEVVTVRVEREGRPSGDIGAGLPAINS